MVVNIRRLDSVLKKKIIKFGALLMVLFFLFGCHSKKTKVSQIILDKATIEIYVGEKDIIKAQAIAENDQNVTIEWTSSHPDIATVIDGEITGITPGKATISAKVGKKISTCLITVKQKQYTVTFNSNGGSEVLPQTVDAGTKLTRPNHPTKPGHYFNGWYLDKSFKEFFSFNTEIYESFTVYAKWVPLMYTVTFVTNSPTVIEPQLIAYNSYLSKPVNPIKEGHTFAGWYLDEQLTIPFDYQINPITGHVTVYAKWKVNQYQVRFVSEDAEEKIVYVEWNSFVNNPTDITKEGHELVGWYYDSDFQVIFNFNYIKVTKDYTLYAKWKKQKYLVNYEVNGGSFIESQEIYWNEYLSLPSNPIREGHTFAGWYYDDTFLIPFDSALPIKNKMTLYAKWDILSFQIVFDTLGGSEIQNKIINWNNLLEVEDEPIKRGYIFGGWYLDREGLIPFNLENPITEDITLYAKWLENDFHPFITFNLNDGYWDINCYQGLIDDEFVDSFNIGTYNAQFYDKNMYYLNNLMLYRKGCNPSLLFNSEDTYKIGISYNGIGYYIDEISKPLAEYDYNRHDYTLICNEQFIDGFTFIQKLIVGQLISIENVDLNNEQGLINGVIKVYNEDTIIYYDNGIYQMNDRLPTPKKDGFEFIGWFDDLTNEPVLYATKYMNVYGLWKNNL